MQRIKNYMLIMMLCTIVADANAQADSTKKTILTNVIHNTIHKVDLRNPIPENQTTKGFGFFCRQELLWEKKLTIPVKLRLGNVDYCNFLEQKTGYTLPKQ